MNGSDISRYRNLKYASYAGYAVGYAVGCENKSARLPCEEVHHASRYVHKRGIIKPGICQFWINIVVPIRINTTDCRVHAIEFTITGCQENLVIAIDKYRAVDMAIGSQVSRPKVRRSGHNLRGSPIKDASEFVKETRVVADVKVVGSIVVEWRRPVVGGIRIGAACRGE